MEYSNLCHDINLKNELNDKTELLSLNITDSYLIKNEIDTYNNLKDNHFLTMFEKSEEEEEVKIINNFFKSEKETISNSNKLFYKDSIKVNDDTIKKQLQLKHRREWARNGRIRKKQFLENIIKENDNLKNISNTLINIIHNCPKCKEQFALLSKKENKYENSNNNKILDTDTKVSNKKKFIFLTTITILSIINIFHIPLNIMKYYNIT